jgi:hypothetical protein
MARNGNRTDAPTEALRGFSRGLKRHPEHLATHLMAMPRVTLQIRVIIDDIVCLSDDEDVSLYVAQAISDGDCNAEPSNIVSFVIEELT